MNKSIISASIALGITTVSFAQKTEQPNFVLYIADDCSYYDLGCYGSDDSKTPHIDNFAKQGMRFTKAYQAVPMSSPTRHNLYTGLWPVRSGAYPNHTRADKGTLSIVHHLHPLGYKVALIGKSHIAPESVFPFDLYIPSSNGELNFQAIQKFISDCTKEGKPFCLFVASNQPHTPWDKGDASQFDPEKISLPPMYVDIPHTRRLFTRYLGEINYMDKEFGTLLSILDKEKVDDKSVIVYLSEQGNSLPFAKWTCYDAGVHSACIVRWQGLVKPGSVSDALVEYVDIVPTFIDIAGGKPLAKVDGKSFKPILTGKRKEHKKYSFSLQTTRGIYNGSDHYGIRSVYDGKYRYIVNLTPEATFQNTESASPLFKEWKRMAKTDAHAKAMTTKYQHRPAIELYDVPNDPYCMNNLAGDSKYDRNIKRLDKKLRGWMRACGDEGQATEMRALEHLAKKKHLETTGNRDQHKR